MERLERRKERRSGPVFPDKNSNVCRACRQQNLINNMKKLFLFKVLLFILISLSLVSCRDDSDKMEVVYTTLSNTRWSNNSFDYSIGNDYITVFENGIEYIFYSATEGLIYEWGKEYDTDFGTSHNRKATHFTYKYNDNEVIITPILTNLSTIHLNYINGILYDSNKESLTKKSIDSNTKSWIDTLHGVTGMCRWYYDLKGNLLIAGDGKMADYSSWDATPWSRLTKYHAINNVNLLGNITYIGRNAFAYSSIGSVTFPQDLECIGTGAFRGTSISSIFLYSKLKTIETVAFSNCKYLKEVYGISGLEIVGEAAFENCKSISLFTCKNLKDIGNFAFAGCNVKDFTPSEVLTHIGSGAFTQCGFTTLKLPNSLESIGHAAFSASNITKIEIGTGLKNITGVPFYTASKGTLYINKNNPITLADNIIEDVYSWTLYVPNGSKDVYLNALYWKNFKTIYESKDLSGDGTEVTPEGPDNQDDDESKYKGSLNGYEWIDLGLSVKWATMNIGANKNSDSGDYFLWGHKSTDWETDNSSLVGIDWSGNVNYDPISILWGQGWKTPTKEEFEELINNCTFSQVKENGISCIKATSKKNNQSIILPLCGRMEGIRDYGDSKDQLKLNGKVAFLWSATSAQAQSDYIIYFFQIETTALNKATCGYRTPCTSIYQSYKRIPMRGVCK